MQFPRGLNQELALIVKHEPFYKGFYDDYFSLKNELDEEDFESFAFMENISESFDSDELSFIDLYKYIHGYCDEFAMMLSKLYGYEIKMAFCGDILIHAWCQKGEYFIDARGITNDEKLFFSEYDMKQTVVYTLTTVEEFFQFAKEMLAKQGSEFTICCQEELNKLEKDSYMQYYYKI